MATTPARVAASIAGDPEISPEVTIKLKESSIRRRRVLIGWNHQNDTPNDLIQGKLWCWVTTGNKLMIFDAMFNRSPKPGEVRFCGVANFTMVRMFHPFWCIEGRVPRDMVSGDKERCRTKYAQRIRQFNIQHGYSVSPEPPATTQAAGSNEGDLRGESSGRGCGGRRGRGRGRGNGRGRGQRQARGGGRDRGRGARRRAAVEAVATGTEEEVPGSISNDPMEIPDDCSDNDSDIDADADTVTSSESEPELNNLRSQSNQFPPHTIREESTENTLRRLNQSGNVEAKPEELGENYGDDFMDELYGYRSTVTPEENEPLLKTEEDQPSTGQSGDPIVVADDDDDHEMFFPLISNSNTSRSPTRVVDDSEPEDMWGGPASEETEVKKELERKRIEFVRTTEGPREVIVIDDD